MVMISINCSQGYRIYPCRDTTRVLWCVQSICVGWKKKNNKQLLIMIYQWFGFESCGVKTTNNDDNIGVGGRIGRWWGNSIVSDIFSRQIMIEFSLCSGTAKPTNRQSIYRTSPLTLTWLDSIHHSIWNFIGITSYENEKEWNSEVRKNIVKVVRLFLWHNHDGNLWWFSPTLCWVRSTHFTLSWYVSRQKKKEQGRKFLKFVCRLHNNIFSLTHTIHTRMFFRDHFPSLLFIEDSEWNEIIADR